MSSEFDDVRAKRESAVSHVIASARIEGAEIPEETVNVFERWAAGEISSEELHEWKMEKINRTIAANT